MTKDKEETSPTQALSTEFSQAYQTIEKPKNVKIEIGGKYTLSGGSGTYDIYIVSIRKIDDQILIYYKWKKEDGKWETTWLNNQVTLETFRAQLLAFGEIKSLELLYPTKKEDKENYYSS